MDEYTIIGWPDIQAFMDLDGFEDNATLINENDSMGIDSSTYLVSVDWLNSFKTEETAFDGKESRKDWKPTEEQMEALNVLNLHGDLSYVGQQNQLISLYQDLKKLI